jgi:capsular polysaccharide biosynthesis protein
MADLQLLDIGIRSVTDIVDVLWRRKRYFLLPVLLSFGIAGALALLLPRSYTSSAVILVEVGDIPPELTDEKVADFAQQRLQAIQRRVLGDERLGAIMIRFRIPYDRKEIRSKLLDANRIEPSSGRPPQVNVTFRVSFEGKEPGTVREVAAELASIYPEENLRRREEPPDTAGAAKPSTERFSIVEPARLPKRPSSPNIPAILLLGLLPGVAIGVWQAFRKEKADNTVRGYEQLSFFPPIPPATGAHGVESRRDLFRHDRGRGFLVATLIISLALFLVLVHYFVMSLDVLWGKMTKSLPL